MRALGFCGKPDGMTTRRRFMAALAGLPFIGLIVQKAAPDVVDYEGFDYTSFEIGELNDRPRIDVDALSEYSERVILEFNNSKRRA